MFIYSRILTEEKIGKVMRAEMFSVQLIWIHISLHLLIYSNFYTESFWLLMLITKKSLAPSTGRENDEKKSSKYKMKIHSIKWESWEKYKQWEQNKSFHKKKKNIWVYFQNNHHDRHLYCSLFSCNVYKGGRGTVRRFVGKTMSVMLRLTVSQRQAYVHTEYLGNALPMFARGPCRPRGSERSGLVAPLSIL